MMRDFELSPFLVPIKDCYIIYQLITQAKQNAIGGNTFLKIGGGAATATTTLSANNFSS